MDSRQHFPGNTNGLGGHSSLSEALLAERRFTQLEMGHRDILRRVFDLEAHAREAEVSDHNRDRNQDKIEALHQGVVQKIEALAARITRIEAENKRIIAGSLMGALGILYQILKPKLGL